jgi:hypothetical protein
MFLLVAILATVLLGICFAAPLPPAPDRAGIGLVCFMVQGPRWICIAVVLGMCVARGAFSWPSDRAVQYVVVFAVHALLGLGCLFCGLLSVERWPGAQEPEWMLRALSLAPLVIPAGQILFASWFLNPALRSGLDASTVRLVTNYAVGFFGVIAFAFAVVGSLVLNSDWKRSSQRRGECAARAKAEAEAKASAEEQAFRSLTAQSPLIDWLRFTEYPHPEAYREAAREAILKRPNLAQDLSAGIASTNNEVSMKLMYFVGQLASPPVEIAEAVRLKARLVVRIAQGIDPATPNSRDVLYDKAHSIANGVQAAAFGLQRTGVDITPELQEMADACRDREKASPRDIAEACERIIKYLATPESKQPVAALRR